MDEIGLSFSQPKSALPFRIDFVAEALIDVEYCQSVNEMFDAQGVHWTIRKATRSLKKFLPEKPGLYMFVWRPFLRLLDADKCKQSFPIILYIGSTGGADSTATLRSRYNEYANLLPGKSDRKLVEPASSRSVRLQRGFMLRELEFWYATPTEKRLILDLESRLIDLLTPPLNHQRPKVRPRRRVAAPRGRVVTRRWRDRVSPARRPRHGPPDRARRPCRAGRDRCCRW